MRIAGIIKNDVVNGIGVCVSLFTQGCIHHCPGCFNPETWDFNGGYETNELKTTIIQAISANGIQRNLSILGGEPLCEENYQLVREIIASVRMVYPNIKIFIWTGCTLDNLQKMRVYNTDLDFILNNIDYLIDGPFLKEEKDLSLWLRGSRNQNVYKLTKDKNFVIIDYDIKTGEIIDNE
jgi:anaerobic ribonucleoside-triphosphate reductase activating protein